MNDIQSGSESYSMPVDTESGETIADNTVITIDAHTGDPLSPHEQYNQPSLEPDDLKVVAVELNDVGKQDLSVDIDTERMALDNNPDHEPTFTAIELNELVMSMAIAKTKCAYDMDEQGLMAIMRVGRAINQSADTLLAEGAQWMDMPGLRPASTDDNQEYVNPFNVIVGKQDLSFVDPHGNRLSTDDLRNSQSSSVVTGN